jgi:hypothetical protein
MPFRPVLLAVAVALLVGAAPAGARIPLGMGEQQARMFDDVRWERLGLRHARVLADWDALDYKRQRVALDQWMAGARATGTRVLLSFRYSRHHRFPTPAVFRDRFAGFLARYPDVDTWGVWNEANHGNTVSARSPRRVARLFDAAVRLCPACRIIGADVLDSENMVRWLRAFKRHARETPRIWGLHNYIDARRYSDEGTRALLRETRGEVWFTETGGWLLRRRYVADEPVEEFRRSHREVVRSTRHILRLACSSARIRRVDLYNWVAPWVATTWDSGLITARGRARPAFRVLRRHVDEHGPFAACGAGRGGAWPAVDQG